MIFDFKTQFFHFLCITQRKRNNREVSCAVQFPPNTGNNQDWSRPKAGSLELGPGLAPEQQGPTDSGNDLLPWGRCLQEARLRSRVGTPAPNTHSTLVSWYLSMCLNNACPSPILDINLWNRHHGKRELSFSSCPHWAPAHTHLPFFHPPEEVVLEDGGLVHIYILTPV